MKNEMFGYYYKNIRCKKNARFNGYCELHAPTKQSPQIEYDIFYNLLGYIAIDECLLCSENMYEINMCKLECGHSFHLKCVKKLRQSSCPVCRNPLKSELLTDEDINKIDNIYKRDVIENNTISATDYQREEWDVEINNNEDEEILRLQLIESICQSTGLSFEEAFSLLGIL